MFESSVPVGRFASLFSASRLLDSRRERDSQSPPPDVTTRVRFSTGWSNGSPWSSRTDASMDSASSACPSSFGSPPDEHSAGSLPHTFHNPSHTSAPASPAPRRIAVHTSSMRSSAASSKPVRQPGATPATTRAPGHAFAAARTAAAVAERMLPSES